MLTIFLSKFVRSLSSLKLTIILLLLSILLVFFSTLNQMHLGIWAVQEKWLRSFIVYQQIGDTGTSIPIFLGGYTIGGMLLLNLVAAHICRFKFTSKKIGIFIIHAGIIVLLIGELLSGIAQEEFQMRLDAGETKNYSESIREVELAVTEVSSLNKSTPVTSIFAEELSRDINGKAIGAQNLPFSIHVLQYHSNALVQQRDNSPSLSSLPPSGATHGIGTTLALIPQPPTHQENTRNLPAALVELHDPENSLGTWLLSPLLSEAQTIEYKGHTWLLQMRFKREYHPWSLTLIEFKRENYIGTDIPKSFSSRLRLVDSAQGDNREVLIYMNKPLRHGGYALYQQGHGNEDRTTILQVVRNPSWMLPYISCGMLSAGLLIQFGMHLFAFISSKNQPRKIVPARNKTACWHPSIVAPVFAFIIGLAWITNAARTPSSENGYDINAFGNLLIIENGRIKPFDTVARAILLRLQGRQSVTVSAPSKAKENTITSSEWLTILLFDPARADTFKIFEITNPDLLGLMQVSSDVGDRGKRFSFQQLSDQILELDRHFRIALKLESSRRNTFQNAVIRLRENILLYQKIKYTLVYPDSTDWVSELNSFQENFHADVAALISRANQQDYDTGRVKRVLELTRKFQLMAKHADLLSIPPDPAIGNTHAMNNNESLAWQKTGDALLDTFDTNQVNWTALTWAKLAHTWKNNQPEQFNSILYDYREKLETRYSAELLKGKVEARFNTIAPFYINLFFYLGAFLLSIFSWLRYHCVLGRTAFALALFAWISSTVGILFRMWLEDRPPVTNLYSSAVFIGWGAVLLCLIVEWIYRPKISNGHTIGATGTAVAGLIGFATLIIAHHLSLSGDTLEMMRAVLNSNFWLATHVTTIVIGYSATFVAGGLAALHIVLNLSPHLFKKHFVGDFSSIIYGIICLATLFSVTGTILGGIWADQSWGRFWGWDPKENGALMLVLWNATILHARWGKLVAQRGFMNLALFGNIITGWSWFGTNLLGVGLHSYGFTQKGGLALGAFFLANLIIIMLSLFQGTASRRRYQGACHDTY